MDLTPEMIGILILEEIKGMRIDFKNIVSEVQSLRTELVNNSKQNCTNKKNKYNKSGKKLAKTNKKELQLVNNKPIKLEADDLGREKFPLSNITANSSHYSDDNFEYEEQDISVDNLIEENNTEEIITTEHYYNDSMENNGESFTLPLDENNIISEVSTVGAPVITGNQSVSNQDLSGISALQQHQRKAPHRKARNTKFHSFTPVEYDLEDYHPKSSNQKKPPRNKSGKNKCQVCGKTLQDSSSLRIHMRIHTGEKPFKCNTCGKCFNRKSSLDLHNTIHTGIRPHNCHVCAKAFLRRDRLRQHMLTHSRFND